MPQVFDTILIAFVFLLFFESHEYFKPIKTNRNVLIVFIVMC